MERVAFLIEPSGERIGCLLNPETLVMRRVAGLRPRRALGGSLPWGGPGDDPLLFTGGGSTELTLDLLFDVALSGSTLQTEDVRDLTEPLWKLAENGLREDGSMRPSLARLVWGKRGNYLCVVAAVAERLEHFASTGAPRRSWLRMRLLRVEDESGTPAPVLSQEPPDPDAVAAALTPEDYEAHTVLGAGDEEAEGGEGAPTGQRLDEIAYQRYGDPSLWRLIAALNGITDPNNLPAGLVLRLPTAEALRRVM
ncbi:CIS tube protein [Pyxidicoccus xibeiensis]|uniref:CIS tube protein n=1 Tax=Pyxidicoccus xibeiensis TaxID=2906759 RepID=UPI0020A82B67|nr:hypothetical protein [Pyxidicoccus xibeiensis]MCP3141709.1 hypothetical protein [Pyxidicoccus xibeiensis]